MRKGFLVSLAALFASAGLMAAQEPALDAQEPVLIIEEWEAPAASRFWGGSEYLLWWFRNSPEPVPLLTAAPASATLAPFHTGALDTPGTQTLIGGSSLSTGPHSGGRFTFGSWLDDDQVLGLEGSYLFLGSRGSGESVSSSGPPTGPFLANPYVNVSPPFHPPAAGATVNYLASPGSAGSAAFSTGSSLQGAEADILHNLLALDGFRLDVLGGFRWLNLREDLLFTTTQAATGSREFANTRDGFNTLNNFYAKELGLRARVERGRWLLLATGKIGLGDMQEMAFINGSTTTNGTKFMAGTLPAVTTVPGGLYALPTSIGDYTRNRFAVAPQATISLSYRLRDGIRIFTGYDFLFLSQVVRPGNQIDGVINDTQLPSLTGVPTHALAEAPARPAFAFQDSSFWAQGISFGVEFRY